MKIQNEKELKKKIIFLNKVYLVCAQTINNEPFISFSLKRT